MTDENKTTAKVAAQQDPSKPADLPAASDFSTSGAPQQITPFDPAHPAVDDNPRQHASALSTRIDFNDPTLDAAEAVAKNLKDPTVNQSTKISADKA